ncbi:radical SAM (seleno)protein TrsS [Ohessyouella blattaphilus]|uniref:Radical SAM protein n=1 Tax=Ohessyouella blattaphilus TaxID=2949333 RepID=A0ABT1EG59_9FIRM|nr:radical SAM (seleno)protein TrsS [Ohessyouella blattaphilus]MCP1109633.1 radical SAM protein [Ohessyouella blattaphilus]MCR8563027.1 radical SAM protein [Ohessyouella blattaphilus]
MTQHSKILQQTKSLCPVCLKRVPAAYEARGEEVWFVKTCPHHGTFETLFLHGVQSFNERMQLHEPQPPKNPANKKMKGCPYDCGLCEHHKQATCCVLLEVTDTCDLGCPTCFASAAGKEEPISLKQIRGWYEMLLERGGPFNIQLSGGEPTMRDDLDQIITLGKELGFSFFQLNTNGLRIGKDIEYLQGLKEAGLSTVFLQFDSLQTEAVITLRGRDIVKEKLSAIANCRAVGLPVVLVPTVMRGCNEEHLGEILEFAASQMPTVKGVHFQPLSYFGRYEKAPDARAHISLPELLAHLEAQTKGQVAAADFSYGRAEHPLCSVNADYRIKDGVWEAVKKPEQDCGCSCSSDVAREAVANKWSKREDICEPSLGKGFRLEALDRFLQERNNQTLAISAMAFQDVWTVDLERLSRCYINIVSSDGHLVPFCAYNLTAMDGTPLYRKAETVCPLKELTGGPIRPGGFRITEAGLKLSGLTKKARMIDLGCGTGETVKWLRDAGYEEVQGLDASPEMIAAGLKLDPELLIKVGESTSLSAYQAQLDGVLMECVLSDSRNPASILRNVRESLKAEGVLILSDLYSLEGDDLPRLLEENGFAVMNFVDYTNELKDLTIKLIMEYGSIADFKDRACASCQKCSLCKVEELKKPGYYLMVCKKRSM